MQIKLAKVVAASALFLWGVASNAAPVRFQGSSDPNLGKTVAQARAEWQAVLATFSTDTLTGAFVTPPFTSAAGNTYRETGNGSTILGSGTSIEGRRNSAPLIQFDVAFPSFVNAVGFDVFDNDGGGMDLLLTDAFTGVVSTFSFISTAGSGDNEFFGVVFDSATFIRSLRVSGTDPGGSTTWDNFSTGVGQGVVVNPNNPNNPVPIPGTLMLAALGLAAVRATRPAKRA